MEVEQAITEVQAAEVNLSIVSLEKQSEVIEAQADAAIAEAKQREAIAEARTEVAEEIVSEEIEETETESEITEEWLTEKFSGLEKAETETKEFLNLQIQNLANQLQQVATNLQLLLPLLILMPTNVLPLIPPTSEAITEIPPMENPEKSAEENQEVKTSEQRKRRKI